TPCATKLCTTSICCLRSSSFRGPFQTISTPRSFEALAAPACTAFQNSWVVPLGMTAILRGLPPDAEPEPEPDPEQAARRAQARARETKCRRVGISEPSGVVFLLIARGRARGRTFAAKTRASWEVMTRNLLRFMPLLLLGASAFVIGCGGYTSHYVPPPDGK